MISACIGWGCLTISSVPGWGFRIHLTPPTLPYRTVGHAIDRCITEPPDIFLETRKKANRSKTKPLSSGWSKSPPPPPPPPRLPCQRRNVRPLLSDDVLRCARDWQFFLMLVQATLFSLWRSLLPDRDRMLPSFPSPFGSSFLLN